MMAGKALKMGAVEPGKMQPPWSSLAPPVCLGNNYK